MARGGAAYLNGLRDGREVWIDGRRVADVTTDATVGSGAHAIAALYDLQLQPDLLDAMTYRSPSSGERVGLSFVQPRSVADLVARREMFRVWAEHSGGMIGRSPDYLNSLLMGCAAARGFFAQGGEEFGARVVAYYERCREQDLCLTHAFSSPQRDRGAAPSPDAAGVRIVDESSDGIVVRGGRSLATLGPFADELLILPSPSKTYHGSSSAEAIAFAVQIAAPGLKLICRESFDLGRSAFDHPLGSRFEEMDAVVVLDDVLVTWDRVFIHRDAELCAGLFRQTTAFTHAIHQFLVKNLVKAELVLGIASLLSETINTAGYTHVQAMLGEIVNAIETTRAFIRAAEADAQPDENGVYVPRPDTLWTARGYFPTVYPRLVEILQLLGASGLMSIPSERTFGSEIGDDASRYLQSATLGGEARVRLFRLAWDVACSAFGGRQVLYERFFAGDPFRNLAGRYLSYDRSRAVSLAERLLHSTD
ncbi:MAG: 4-hydroxyphenylacetate 3-monooxygenase, oxygenase component [Chloroflexi bacterium]|nr:4-hydroxyphenylacetate 3-monooxygenase, oxygenase component [Chloroflexota bacterium]